jgi:hypothetical protein
VNTPPSFPSRSLGGIASRRGFALLITLTLLAFLVVLLVGLATYTRVETAVIGNTQRQAQARENALLALNVALGQLQKNAGPDQRVTATGKSFGGMGSAKHYTGVWNAVDSGTTPMTWLVSGSEIPTNTATTLPSLTARNSIQLVGQHTSGMLVDDYVSAPLVPIPAVTVPGKSGTTTVGNYAWWIGDQGVKAAVGVPDETNSLVYAPFDSDELRSRISQQISIGGGAAALVSDTAGNPAANPVFEIRDADNQPLVRNQKILVYGQLAFLKSDSNTPIGLTGISPNFQRWSPNNYAVLANTKLGGLRQDLSVDPALLGASFAAWANYSNYMEDPTAPLAPLPLQGYSTDPVRRRYVMQPADSDYGIAPVLSYFGLSFSVRNDLNTQSPTQLEVSSRCVVGLWNPYSAALVPNLGGLQLRVTGLPDVVVTDTAGDSQTVVLQDVMGQPSLNFFLPWIPDGFNDDRSSWLPGRVYNWSALANSSDPGDPGNPTAFYERSAQQGAGVIRVVGAPLAPSSNKAPVYRQCTVSNPTTLTVELWRVADGVKLAEFRSPTFDAFQTSGNELQTDHKFIDFAFIFRLPDAQEVQTGETATWLQASGRDPREVSFPSNGYVVAGNSPYPPVFGGLGKTTFDASNPDLLLDRYTDEAATNYNEDVPVFELPRAPLLSIGTLQHLRIKGARPFTIANSWATGVQLNGVNADELFDRFFFSGLAAGVALPTDAAPNRLPNPLLKVLRNPATGVTATVADLQGATAYTSKFLLQGGAFNLNSTDATAWAAILRSVRWSGGIDFSYLDVDPTTGTATDTSTALAGFSGAGFFRFSQSAQEVFKANDDYAQSVFGGGGPTINTPLYRRGVRLLSNNEVGTLASQIANLVEARTTVLGPFRSLQEFLSPSEDFGGQSLFEQAIADSGINASIAEFSSQFLTQADIMTALAPVLFPRSDTFVIRTYGEALNPATGAVEGRAWCEATVQRVPEFFDKAQPEETPFLLLSADNLNFGRRFKVVSFRWLTSSDI